jgi:hypothetical protein
MAAWSICGAVDAEGEVLDVLVQNRGNLKPRHLIRSALALRLAAISRGSPHPTTGRVLPSGLPGELSSGPLPRSPPVSRTHPVLFQALMPMAGACPMPMP